jgi:hypoxanthine phosphoribosyltransferase
MKMRYLTWEEVDEAVAQMPKPICDSFYPIPRGGFVLAVMLSHKWGKPIVDRPTKLSIIVDDIADSGQTLRDTRLRYPYPAYVLVKRNTCQLNAITHAISMKDEDWIVFPWENKEKAKEDYDNYISRQ